MQKWSSILQKTRAAEIKKIVKENSDVLEAATVLVEEGYAVSRAEAKRIYRQLKDKA